ncbi:COMM domain-containing protein 6 [Ixodes scapularis]|uniref:COMM domain-containing protein 6 n=1 Tax=Ixodes scapularis TaxID=6945 RepID=UPI001A9E3DE6|nr:COMM domain-containing protein 6 [Ixodes scapularis]
MSKVGKGLLAAAETLKKYPVDVQKALLRSATDATRSQNIEEKAESCNLTPRELHEAVEAASCMLASFSRLKEAAMSTTLQQLFLDPGVADVLKELLQSKGSSSSEFSPYGKLVDVRWKIGVAAVSDQCKNLNSPFVTFQLTVEDSQNRMDTHILELTIPEFQKFASTMQELHGIMSTL